MLSILCIVAHVMQSGRIEFNLRESGPVAMDRNA